VPRSPDSSRFLLRGRASLGSKVLTASFSNGDSTTALPVKTMVACGASVTPADATVASRTYPYVSRIPDIILRMPSGIDHPNSPPNFVDAGWDSCSDISTDA
jgi:hypothetical protein